MIPALDFCLFGSGRGIKMPASNGIFYFLNGHFYTWIGGFGAQLSSFQWTHPRPGVIRTVAGHRIRPFQSHRRGPRVHVSWALCTEITTIEKIHKFHDDITKSC